ncbi:MAG: hypothetical protein U5O39_04465 [Gammaproteobacteria bacterium]|nr:hypothetical protein [Gammaproteobacteria bacterium]
MWAGIKAHERGETVVDPITGYEVTPPQSRGVDENVGWGLDHFSLGELEMLKARGKGALRRRTLLVSVVFVVATIGATYWLLDEVNLDTEPGLLAVMLVVAAGLSLTGVVYHLIRFVAAGRLEVPPPDIIARHISTTRHEKEEMKVGVV